MLTGDVLKMRDDQAADLCKALDDLEATLDEARTGRDGSGRMFEQGDCWFYKGSNEDVVCLLPPDMGSGPHVTITTMLASGENTRSIMLNHRCKAVRDEPGRPLETLQDILALARSMLERATGDDAVLPDDPRIAKGRDVAQALAAHLGAPCDEDRAVEIVHPFCGRPGMLVRDDDSKPLPVVMDELGAVLVNQDSTDTDYILGGCSHMAWWNPGCSPEETLRQLAAWNAFPRRVETERTPSRIEKVRTRMGDATERTTVKQENP
jgi:hypothetical protein